MYNKVKKCLESIGYEFTQFERLNLSNGLALTNGFLVEKVYHDKVRLAKSYHADLYIEIYDSGYIVIWSLNDGRPLYIISKKEDYISLFHLAWVLNN